MSWSSNAWIRAVLLCLTLPLLAACATSGQTFAQMQSNEAPLAVDAGRIYVYRIGSFVGSGVQPSVKIDGTVIGDAVPGGFYFVDRPAGNYKISASTEVERDLSVTLEAGQKRYVRLDVSMGFVVGHVSPTLVDDSIAAKEIKDCHYLTKK